MIFFNPVESSAYFSGQFLLKYVAIFQAPSYVEGFEGGEGGEGGECGECGEFGECS